MTDMLSASFCTKCGRAVTPEAEFCAGCGTRIRASLFDTPSSPGNAASATGIDAATILPTGGGPSAAPTILPTSGGGSATRMGTSAGHTPRFGDGGFRAGDQIGPRYTILKLLGTGGMG